MVDNTKPPHKGVHHHFINLETGGGAPRLRSLPLRDIIAACCKAMARQIKHIANANRIGSTEWRRALRPLEKVAGMR